MFVDVESKRYQKYATECIYLTCLSPRKTKNTTSNHCNLFLNVTMSVNVSQMKTDACIAIVSGGS